MDDTSPGLEIYIYRDGEYLGPFTERELRRHWANGVVQGSDYVWYEGMADWINLRDYFGVPAALTSAAIRSGEVDLEVVRARFAEPARDPEPEYEYLGHPAAQSGWIVFLSWTLLGGCILASVVFVHRPAIVGTAAALAVLGALLHLARFRAASSFGLLVASILLPVVFWWLAHTFLPAPEAQEKSLAIQPDQGSVMVEQGSASPRTPPL
jgi:hypothetical protein